MTSKLLTFSVNFQDLCIGMKNDIAQRISKHLIESTAKFDAISCEMVDEKLMFSYLPDGKVVDSIWKNPYRQTGRPVAVLGKIFGEQYKKEDYEKFVAQLKNLIVAPNGEVEVVEGDEIKKAYYYENYILGRGTSTLEKSCMRYDTHQLYLDIYTDNVDVVKLAKVNVEGKVGARALLWTADLDGNKVSVLDRKYCFNTEYETLLENWAKENVDFIRIHSKKLFLNTKTNLEESLLFTIPFKIKNINSTAYVDTFKWYNQELELLSNVYDGTTDLYNLANPAMCGTHHRARAIAEEGKVYACLGGDFLEGRSELRKKEDCKIYQDFWFPKNAHVTCAECKKQVFNDGAVLIGDTYYCYNHRSVTVDGTLQPLCYTHSVIGECDRCLNYRKCGTCRQELHKNVLKATANNEYFACAECIELERFVYCKNCNELHLRGTLHTVAKASYCGPCVTRLFKDCYNCGIYHPIAEVPQVKVRGAIRYMCDSCITDCLCTECDNINTYNIVVNGEVLCENCYYQITANCISCQTVTHQEDMTEGVCNDCREAIG